MMSSADTNEASNEASNEPKPRQIKAFIVFAGVVQAVVVALLAVTLSGIPTIDNPASTREAVTRAADNNFESFHFYNYYYTYSRSDNGYYYYDTDNYYYVNATFRFNDIAVALRHESSYDYSRSTDTVWHYGIIQLDKDCLVYSEHYNGNDLIASHGPAQTSDIVESSNSGTNGSNSNYNDDRYRYDDDNDRYHYDDDDDWYSYNDDTDDTGAIDHKNLFQELERELCAQKDSSLRDECKTSGVAASVLLSFAFVFSFFNVILVFEPLRTEESRIDTTSKLLRRGSLLLHLLTLIFISAAVGSFRDECVIDITRKFYNALKQGSHCWRGGYAILERGLIINCAIAAIAFVIIQVILAFSMIYCMHPPVPTVLVDTPNISRLDMSTTEEKVLEERCQALKVNGNNHFRNKHWEGALEQYNMAIDLLLPSMGIGLSRMDSNRELKFLLRDLYMNRIKVLRLRENSDSPNQRQPSILLHMLEDCNMAIRLDGQHDKLQLIRANVVKALSQFPNIDIPGVKALSQFPNIDIPGSTGSSSWLFLSPHKVIWAFRRSLAHRIPYGLPGTDGSFKLNLREFIKTEHSLLSLYYCHDLHVFTSWERLSHFGIVQLLVMVISFEVGRYGGAAIFFLGPICMALSKRLLRLCLEGECLFSDYQPQLESDVTVVYDEQGWMYENLQCFGGRYRPGCSGTLTSWECCLCLFSGVRCSHWDRDRRACQSILTKIYSWGGALLLLYTFRVLSWRIYWDIQIDDDDVYYDDDHSYYFDEDYYRIHYGIPPTWKFTYPLSLLFSFFIVEMFMLWFHYYRVFDRAQNEFLSLFRQYVGPNMINLNGDVGDPRNILRNYDQVHRYARACHIARHGLTDYESRMRFVDHWFIRGAPFSGGTLCHCTGKNSLAPSWFDPIFDWVYMNLSAACHGTDRDEPSHAVSIEMNRLEGSVVPAERGEQLEESNNPNKDIYWMYKEDGGTVTTEYMENPMTNTVISPKTQTIERV